LTFKYPYPTIKVHADVQDVSSWQNAIADIWQEMPDKARKVANQLVSVVIVVNPNDPRLTLGYTKEPKAAAIGNTLILSCSEDVNELLHEVAHTIVDRGFTGRDREAVDHFYDFSDSERAPSERLAEDFYFTVKGDEPSPFWQWWFERGLVEGEKMRTVVAEKIAKLARNTSVNPLHVVEAVLDAFAEELVYDFGGEEHVWLYGIAREALKEAQKEDQLAYENRSAPHQYYYAEDLATPPTRPRKQPLGEPLKVERPDVTMRGTYTTPPMV